MAKKIGTLLALFLVAYMGAHFYIRWKNTVTDDVTKISRMVDCHPNDFRAIRIEQSAEGKPEELSFIRVDKPEPGLPSVTAASRWEWRFEKTGGEVDPVAVRRIASTICELYDPIAIRESEFQPANKGSGRVAQKISATLLVAEGKEQKISFEFGAPAANRENLVRFTFGDQSPKGFRISDRFASIASKSPEEFRNLRVMKLEADNVQQATLRINGKERFTLERAGADWKVFLNGKEKGDGAETAERFLNRVSTLQALTVSQKEFTAQNCEAAKAKAELILKGIGGKEEQLRFNYEGDGPVSACSSLGSQQLTVHHDLVKYIDIPIQSVLLN